LRRVDVDNMTIVLLVLFAILVVAYTMRRRSRLHSQD
jgi:hypothetical protein